MKATLAAEAVGRRFLLVAASALTLAGCTMQTVIGFEHDISFSTPSDGSHGDASSGTGGTGGAASSSAAGGASGDTSSSGDGGATPDVVGDPPILLYAARAMQTLQALAVDAKNIYVADVQSPNGSVLKVPLDGGEPTTLAHHQRTPVSLAVDGTNAYWLTLDAVMKAPLNGDPPSALASISSGGSGASLALDAENVYFTDYAYNGTVARVPKKGGALSVIAAHQSVPRGISTDGVYVYWQNEGDATIMKAKVGGGKPTLLAGGRQFPLDITVDAKNVYWAEMAGAVDQKIPMTLLKAKLDGGEPEKLAFWGHGGVATTIAVDATYLYAVAPSCTLAKVPIRGGPLTTLSFDESLGCPRSLTQDADHLYWTSVAGVVKVHK